MFFHMLVIYYTIKSLIRIGFFVLFAFFVLLDLNLDLDLDLVRCTAPPRFRRCFVVEGIQR